MLSCTKETVFDPDFRPSADPSIRTGSVTGSTPSNVTTLPTPHTYISNPSGSAPPHRTGVVPNPSKEFWQDEFPRAVDPVRPSPANEFSSVSAGQTQAQVSPNDPNAWQGSADMAAPGTGTAGRATFGSSRTMGMFSAANGNGSLPDFSDMRIDELDISKWFDIPNLSFEESSLEQMVGMAQDSGAMFTPGAFASMFP